jgi:hypothetical protein
LHCFHPGFPFPSALQITHHWAFWISSSVNKISVFLPVYSYILHTYLAPTYKHIKCRPMLEEVGIPQVIENQILKQ